MNRGCPDFQATSRLSRRSLLRVGSLGLAGLSLPSVLRAASDPSKPHRPATAKNVIFLHQFGGPSHIDTFDMKPDAPEGIRGEFSPIASAVPGVNVTEHLPRFAQVMDRVAQIRSVHHRMKNHNSASYYSLTGHAPPLDDIRLRDTLELFPSYGSVVSKLRPSEDPAVPSYVSYPHVLRDGSVTPGQHASFLGKPYDPFFIGQDPSEPGFRLPELELPESTPLGRLDDRRGLLELIDRQAQLLEYDATARGIDEFYSRALSMLASPRVKGAFDLSQEPDALRDRYGRTTYGQSCLLARRLVETGVRFVTVYFSRSIGGNGSNGWDTHQDNFNDLKNRLLPITDQTVPFLIQDLDDRGLLDETLIVWMGEFGRGPKIGDRDGKGRNHWPSCYTVLFAGGGTTGGAVYGSSDRIGGYPAIDPVPLESIAATMYHALGIDPETEVFDRLNRPLAIASQRPITEIFA
ncbi:DUF1501 domain-containing protein [Tautonia rosea]|uniref:DUF1501 domain-containing protein n=1 Tax=Tautonia rosea TaxID=2728037 RepID=UPI001474C49F|nr:DUF1501 domain-containing protein [Tautonia rosea]